MVINGVEILEYGNTLRSLTIMTVQKLLTAVLDILLVEVFFLQEMEMLLNEVSFCIILGNEVKFLNNYGSNVRQFAKVVNNSSVYRFREHGVCTW